MQLFKQESERLDKNGKPFNDLYIGWVHNGKPYTIRVVPFFKNEFPQLYATAVEVPKGELISKYL